MAPLARGGAGAVPARVGANSTILRPTFVKRAWRFASLVPRRAFLASHALGVGPAVVLAATIRGYLGHPGALAGGHLDEQPGARAPWTDVVLHVPRAAWPAERAPTSPSACGASRVLVVGAYHATMVSEQVRPTQIREEAQL